MIIIELNDLFSEFIDVMHLHSQTEHSSLLFSLGEGMSLHTFNSYNSKARFHPQNYFTSKTVFYKQGLCKNVIKHYSKSKL